MLEEYREIFQQSARLIPNWNTMDKNELCRLCIKHENDRSYDNYLSALICRYWNLISKFYSISTNLAEPDDCYNWLIDSITYALAHRQWDNPESPIFNDPKGPDKVINRCMKSSRLIFYQFKNRKKRRKEYQLISIDEIKENMNSDSIDIEDTSFTVDEETLDISFMIESIFNRKEYFLAFILDCICNDDVFDDISDGYVFNLKKLCKYFRNIDESYINYFSEKYNIDYDKVYQAAILAKNVPDSKLSSKIQEMLLRLKHSEIISQIRR